MEDPIVATPSDPQPPFDPCKTRHSPFRRRCSDFGLAFQPAPKPLEWPAAVQYSGRGQTTRWPSDPDPSWAHVRRVRVCRPELAGKLTVARPRPRVLGRLKKPT